MDKNQIAVEGKILSGANGPTCQEISSGDEWTLIAEASPGTSRIAIEIGISDWQEKSFAELKFIEVEAVE